MGKGSTPHRNALKCVPRAPLALAAIPVRRLRLSEKGGGKAQRGRSGIRRLRTLLRAGLGTFPCRNSCPGSGSPSHPDIPYLSLAFPPAPRTALNSIRRSREELAALPRPSTKALLNSLFSLNYTKAMTVLSSLYNASV